MNKYAYQLGMNDTFYMNAHGKLNITKGRIA